MKIDLKKLTGAGVAHIPFSDTLDLSGETLYGAQPFQSPVQISGEVTNDLGVLRLRGTIKTIYSTACARCLKPLEILLTAEADTILTDDPDAEEEDDLFVLTTDSVDPADILVPALILQVQMTYLCKEDCKGLCPHCGADRNVVDCGCESKQVDPRFAALRALLDSKGDE
ncbi:YceD family protein [Agathobaculum sp.]|uniref:YceD family protein n=1 Tax=Agathobaculum sp. TaxID=2048138 RepID=UPI002A83EE9F|nr:DUF177 domain-containing protein [Agathobaculum sp.]MDY3618487.1 DUF177 domain-containing protein [Agathobaculum sp.]